MAAFGDFSHHPDNCRSQPAPFAPVAEPVWDLAAQPAPDFEVDQRVSW